MSSTVSTNNALVSGVCYPILVGSNHIILKRENASVAAAAAVDYRYVLMKNIRYFVLSLRIAGKA